MKRFLILAMLVVGMAPLAGCVVYPAHPYAHGGWVPGHYGPYGGWVPGHYR